jgi:hypothetical protein
VSRGESDTIRETLKSLENMLQYVARKINRLFTANVDIKRKTWMGRPPAEDKSLPIEPAGTLIARDRLGSHHAMEGKARFVFPVLISGLIVFVVGAVVTFTNIGLRADFVVRWLKAFVTGWPVAALLAFFAGPYIRRAAEAIVRRIDGAAQSYCAGLMPSVSPIRLTVCS